MLWDEQGKKTGGQSWEKKKQDEGQEGEGGLMPQLLTEKKKERKSEIKYHWS